MLKKDSNKGCQYFYIPATSFYINYYSKVFWKKIFTTIFGKVE